MRNETRMKASDTVLKLSDLVRLENETLETDTDIEASLIKQAEISLLAGRKEVVEWLRKNCPDEYGSLSGWEVFLCQLKEWGIDVS